MTIGRIIGRVIVVLGMTGLFSPVFGAGNEELHTRATELMGKAAESMAAGDTAGVEPMYAATGTIAAKAPEDIYLARIHGGLGAWLSVTYGSKGDYAKAFERYGDLKTIGKRFPDSLPLAAGIAQTAATLYPLFRMANWGDEAAVLRADVKALTERWKEDAIVRTAWEQIEAETP